MDVQPVSRGDQGYEVVPGRSQFTLGQLARSTAFLFRRHAKSKGVIKHLAPLIDIARTFITRADLLRTSFNRSISAGDVHLGSSQTREAALAAEIRRVSTLLRKMEQGDSHEEELMIEAERLVQLSSDLDLWEFSTSD
jgi:hypothetical protein